MCLDPGFRRITQSSLVESGWKEFNGSGTALRFQNFNLAAGVPLDKWIQAEETPVSAGSGSYTSGFHIYTDETQLKGRSQFRHVYFRNAHTVGQQGGLKVSVAKELYVPSDPNAWPPR